MDAANQNGPFAPSFDGKASSFLDYEQRVALWLRSTDVPAERQSTLLILHMDPAARQVCMLNSEEDALMTGCDVQLVMRALRDYFQPETFDRIFTQMHRFVVCPDGATDWEIPDGVWRPSPKGGEAYVPCGRRF